MKPVRSNALSRRQFLMRTLGHLAAATAGASALQAGSDKPLPFRISLAQWSLKPLIDAGTVPSIEFPTYTKKTFGLDAIEYVNTFFPRDGGLTEYVTELRMRCHDAGVKSLLIMCDGEGSLGDPNEGKRVETVRNHEKWLEAAAGLGCHSIRVNAHSEGTYTEQMKLAADGLERLCVLAEPYGLNVIVENHGGLSSNPEWLEGVFKKVALPNCGSLPDFGNFEEYDRYAAAERLMPYAKGVSAKSQNFDAEGNETDTDFLRMIPIVLRSGYKGYIGIEYEGHELSPEEGILATKKLLIRARNIWMAKS